MDNQTLRDIGFSPTIKSPKREWSTTDNQPVNEEELQDDTELADNNEVDKSTLPEPNILDILEWSQKAILVCSTVQGTILQACHVLTEQDGQGVKGLKGQARVITKLDRCGGKRVEHAGQGAINKQSGCVPEMDRFNKEANIRVKGELVGKSIPPDGNQTSPKESDRTRCEPKAGTYQ